MDNQVQYGQLIADQVFQTIESFGELSEGWCYGSGRPIRKPMRVRAESVVHLLKVAGLDRFEAFPSDDGEILISAGISGDLFAEVLCLAEGGHNLIIGDANKIVSEEYNIPLFKVWKSVSGMAWKAKNSTVSFIPSITAINRDDLSVWRSNHQKTVARLSARNAQIKQAGVNANIFRDFTGKEYVASLQYSAA